MSAPRFQELDYRNTALGELSLRRRREPRLDDALVYEVVLGDEFLMSSLFTVGERALATLALARVGAAQPAVVVGGLGLGYTAHAALAGPSVAELVVIEALAPVIDWHRRGLVPLGEGLCADPRCRLVCGDFFALGLSAEGFDHEQPGRCFDAVLLDIDHSPRHRLGADGDDFYTRTGLSRLARHLAPGGVFAMWSNDPPDAAFRTELEAVFGTVSAEIVRFDNPYTGQPASCTIYLAE